MPSYTMAADKDQKDEITAVGPGADEDPSQEEVRTGGESDSGYQYPEGDDEDSSERREARDERIGHSEESEDDSDGGLSENQKRRRRKREKYERDQRELSFLRSRNEQLERDYSRRMAQVETRQAQSDVLAIDGRIQQAESELRETETLYAQARKQNDPEAEMLALRARDELSDGLKRLKNVKEQTQRAAQARDTTAQQQPNAPDPTIVRRAQEWARENPWFNPQNGDEDSLVAYAVEQAVFRDGRFGKGDGDDYWEEVDRRLAKRLPERYRDARRTDPNEDDEDDRDTRRERRVTNGNGTRKPSGPTIKVGGRERSLKKGEVYIDEDRKQAMIGAGVWDDPKERERFLKSYQKYDRDAGRRPR